MHFGFLLFARELQGVAPAAALGEQCGFDLLGVVDSPALAYDPYVALTLAAQATSRIRLGTAVTNPQTRHPLITANQAATINQVAPERFYLGIGTGFSGVRHAGAGPATLAALESTVQTIRRLLAGDAVSADGAELALHLERRPVPILIAASGPRSLRLAGRLADIVMFNLGATPEVNADALTWIREGAESAGRDPAGVESWLYIPAAVDPDREVARQIVLPAAISSASFILQREASAKRVPPEVAERISRLLRGYQYGQHLSPGRTANCELAESLGLTEYLLERFAIAGTPDDCRRQIEAVRSVGVRNICLNLSPAPDLQAQLRLWGAEVLPAFRETKPG